MLTGLIACIVDLGYDSVQLSMTLNAATQIADAQKTVEFESLSTSNSQLCTQVLAIDTL